MKTKNTFLSFAILLAFFVSFSEKTYADNTTGNVEYNVWYDQNEKMLIMVCEWKNNQTYIDVEFNWDTKPNSYGSGYKMGKFVGLQGQTTHKIKVDPCVTYYTKVVFKDGYTSDSYTIERSHQTQGNLSPLIRSARFNQIGYVYAILSLEVDGNCNGSTVEISMNEVGEVPYTVYTGGFYNNQTFSVPLFGLKANVLYEVGIKCFNHIGSTYTVESFRTKSNLIPFIESTGVVNITDHSVDFKAYIDTKNTDAKWRIALGKTIQFENFTDWVRMYHGEGNISSTFNDLEPNTVYFWAPQTENPFGGMTAQPRMFKTDGSALFMKELTFDDLLKVSSNTGKISIFVEQSAKVEVTNINGQIVGTYNVADQMDVNLMAGTYIVKTNIGGKTLVKKAIVF